MSTYYHVTNMWDGGDLVSLYEQYGEESYLIYCDRWPDARELAQYHVHSVHLYGSLSEAMAHQRLMGGGMILEINADHLDIVIDGLEFTHPTVDRVPRHYIKVLTRSADRYSRQGQY